LPKNPNKVIEVMFNEQERAILLKNPEFLKAMESFEGGPEAIASLADLGHKLLPAGGTRKWPPQHRTDPPAP
jgi:hypothetical protein